MSGLLCCSSFRICKSTKKNDTEKIRSNNDVGLIHTKPCEADEEKGEGVCQG